jgi:hypothetical protein
MGDVTPTSGSQPLPIMSPELRGWLLDDLDMEWVPPSRGRPAIRLPRYRDTSSAVRAEAARILPIYRKGAQPADAKFLHGWLQPLAAVVRNPVSVDELDTLSRIFAHALADVPRASFTDTAWRRAMQTFKFWPSVADVAELVADDAQEIRRAVEVLTFITEGDRA